MRGFAILIAAVALTGCASSAAPPSLLPRPAEAIDPRVEVVRPMNDRPVNASLAGQLAMLVFQSLSGDVAFVPAAADAQRLSASAVALQSESLIAAEEALSR